MNFCGQELSTLVRYLAAVFVDTEVTVGDDETVIVVEVIQWSSPIPNFLHHDDIPFNAAGIPSNGAGNRSGHGDNWWTFFSSITSFALGRDSITDSFKIPAIAKLDSMQITQLNATQLNIWFAAIYMIEYDISSQLHVLEEHYASEWGADQGNFQPSGDKKLTITITMATMMTMTMMMICYRSWGTSHSSSLLQWPEWQKPLLGHLHHLHPGHPLHHLHLQAVPQSNHGCIQVDDMHSKSSQCFWLCRCSRVHQSALKRLWWRRQWW